ncbi:MAG: inositol monophosphatase family protein, partial [Bacteroidota bacterium]
SGFTFQCAYYDQFDQLKIGVIYDPLRDVMVYAIKGEGVYWLTQNQKQKIPAWNTKAWEELRYANHRKYMTGTIRRMYESLGVEESQIIPTGGIGSKCIDFVEGKVDVLISLNRAIGAWDWAPGKVILEELGWKLCHLTGEELEINKADKGFGYLVCPPEHYDTLCEKLDWIIRKVNPQRTRDISASPQAQQ